jgi:hypothetical protein
MSCYGLTDEQKKMMVQVAREELDFLRDSGFPKPIESTFYEVDNVSDGKIKYKKVEFKPCVQRGPTEEQKEKFFNFLFENNITLDDVSFLLSTTPIQCVVVNNLKEWSYKV